MSDDRISGPFQRPPQTATDRLADWWGWLTDPWSSQIQYEILRRLHNLEIRMSKISDALAEVDAETTALAARIDTVMERAVAQLDADTANELRGVSARLKGMAADPNNPVPDPAPAPEEPLPPVEEPRRLMALLDTAEELWALRDWVSTLDDPDADPAAAQMIGVYNALLVEAGAATAE